MREMFTSFILGIVITVVLGWSYVWNADGRCLARAEKARSDYRMAEQLRNGEIAFAQDVIVNDNLSREIIRDARYNHVLKKLRGVTHEGCIIPEILKEALVEAENIQ